MSDKRVSSIAPRRNQRLVMPKIPKYVEFYQRTDGFESTIPAGNFGFGLMWTVATFLFGFPFFFADHYMATIMGGFMCSFFAVKAARQLFMELRVTIAEGKLVVNDSVYFTKMKIVYVKDIRSVKITSHFFFTGKCIKIETDNKTISFALFSGRPRKEFVYKVLVYQLDKLMDHQG